MRVLRPLGGATSDRRRPERGGGPAARPALRWTALALAVTLLSATAVPQGAEARGPACATPAADGITPYWARQRSATVLVDSVLLSGAERLRAAMPCRRLALRGRPALMLRAAEQELRARGRRVAPLVVVGLGYNSLWERERHNHARWAARFDGESVRLLRTLRRLGARQFVWVTLREPTAAIVPRPAHWELRRYAWYFPYVNERLRALDRRRDDLVLADWAAVSGHGGLTYDSIHLTRRGGLLMARTIKVAIAAEAERQAQARRGRETAPASRPAPAGRLAARPPRG